VDAHKVADDAQREFSGYRVIVFYSERSLKPQVSIFSLAPFDGPTLKRLLSFANRRSLQLHVGCDSDALDLHVAILTEKGDGV
jgi:hypothetical protein